MANELINAARLPGLILIAGAIAISSPFAHAGDYGFPGRPQGRPVVVVANALPSSHRVSHSALSSQQGSEFYARLWGIDRLRVRSIASGSMLEFRYRVLNPEKAEVLSDKRVSPELIDDASGARLGVPQMENIGALRQAVTPEAGKEYWMIFTNPHKAVKPGDRVDIVVGKSFRVSGLAVE